VNADVDNGDPSAFGARRRGTAVRRQSHHIDRELRSAAGRRQGVEPVDRQDHPILQIEASLIGDERHLIRLSLEAMADLSKTLPALSSIVSGIPLVAGLTVLLDCQIAA
jgi:hypothetical protein